MVWKITCLVYHKRFPSTGNTQLLLMPLVFMAVSLTPRWHVLVYRKLSAFPMIQDPITAGMTGPYGLVPAWVLIVVKFSEGSAVSKKHVLFTVYLVFIQL